MKSIAIAVIVLLFLVSCSGTGKIVTADGISPDVVSPPDRSRNAPAAKKGVRSPTGSLVGSRAGEKIILSEDDDNITSLLAHDDFKDFELPIVFNEAVKYYVIYFTTEKKKVFANWLKRSRRYVPMIKVILKEHGLPEDLAYLAMIESGFNPKAYSPAKACGPWQFIYETGGRYGLKANFWIDERRDPEKSTVAAAKYLTDLFTEFGCWYLAAAGYNAGEKRVERAIEKHNTMDFWELAKYNALPKETREYIPKLIAASIIAKDPERFGFGSITYEDPVRFVEIKVPRATPVAAIARASGMGLTEWRSINPEVLRGITPPDSDDYRIKLPASVDVAQFTDGLETQLEKERRITEVVSYKVKKKDTLAKIMKRYGVRTGELLLVNNCDEQLKVKPGMTLIIPRFEGPSHADHTALAAAEPVKARAPAARSAKAEKTSRQADESEKADKAEPAKAQEEREPAKTYHVVQKGETLSGISTRYGVEMASLISLNNLKGKKVYPNMKLMLASYHSPKNREETAAVGGRTVKKGETSSHIASKSGVSMGRSKPAGNLKSAAVHHKVKPKIGSAKADARTHRISRSATDRLKGA